MGGAKVDEESVNDIIKQKPNRKVLVFSPYLGFYNLKDPEKVTRDVIEKQQRLEAKNQDRLARGKDPKPYRRTFHQWLQEEVGEPPVILDSTLLDRSAEQIRIFMMKKGYFKAKVDYDVNLRPLFKKPEKRKRANVTYIIEPGQMSTIDSIEYKIPDERIDSLAHAIRKEEAVVKHGMQFDVDKLDSEREAVTRELRNMGFYVLSKEYFQFDVDTTRSAQKVDVTMRLLPWSEISNRLNDTLYKKNYPAHRIRNIYISVREAVTPKPSERDTVIVNGYNVITSPSLTIDPNVLIQHILFRPGDAYMVDRVQTTYKRLSQLPLINSANIQFEVVDDVKQPMLDGYIVLAPAKKQNLTVEWNGTNNEGILGVNGSVSYSNRNIFRGSELLRINLSGGLEAQQPLTSEADDPAGQVSRDILFNTVEFGPELSLEFPKFLIPVSLEKFSKSSNPSTRLSSSFSYQERPDYLRRRLRFSMSYSWNETDEKRWIVTPFELSIISIDKSQAFQNRLDEIDDPYLSNSYSDQFIPNLRVSYIFNNQQLAFQRRSFYYLSEVETAGLLWRAAYQASSSVPDEQDSYRVNGTRFANYVKLSQELRWHHNFSERSSMAYRFFGGLGIPLENLNALPFEKSYFGGGANGIRAWQARTLGPGSYTDPNSRFDRIGDIQLEANAEYRFDVINFLEGAFFVDAGNIWLLRQALNDAGEVPRPGATFETDDFLSEIAVGAGVGVRLDFDYFLIRFDVGLQLKDPSLPMGERWLFEPKDEYNEFVDQLNNQVEDGNPYDYYKPRANINLGIGYPF